MTLHAIRAKDFVDSGNYLVVDSSRRTVALIYRDPESREWYEDASANKHYTECWLGGTKKEALATLVRHGRDTGGESNRAGLNRAISNESARGQCDHCGTPAKRRYPVRIKGRPGISMVGSSCAKRFPRARASDLIRSIQQDQRSQRGKGKHANRYLAEVLGLGYATMPSRLSPQEFADTFRQMTVDPNDPNKKVPLNVMKYVKGKVFELYKWKGFGVIVSASALDTSFDPAVRMQLFDPYTGLSIDSLIGYQKTPLGLVVSQTLRKDKHVQGWLDAFPKWDPIAEHVTLRPANPSTGSTTMPPPVRDSGGVFNDLGDQSLIDFRKLLKRSISNKNYFHPILIGDYGMSVQGGDGFYSDPKTTFTDPYQYNLFEIRILRMLRGTTGKFIKPKDIPEFPDDLADLWEPYEDVAGFVAPEKIQRIMEHLHSLKRTTWP